MNIARFAARLLIGGLFVGHGTQKLVGAFDGPGIEGTEQMMEDIDMYPPRLNAYAAGFAETAGGALFTIGKMTPLSGAVLIGAMVTAIRKVHASNGPWIAQRGWEYNAVLIATIAAIVEDEHGLAAALGAVGLGAAASALTIELSKPKQTPDQSYPVEAIADAGETGTVTPDTVRDESRRTA